MFENAQQEPSGNTTKVIGGVLVVALLVMAGIYFMLPKDEAPAGAPAAAPGAAPSAANTPVPDADFHRDIVAMRVTLSRDQTQTQAIWTIQVSNRSREITYRNIKYATNYLDNTNNVIQRGSGTLPGELGPGEQRTFTGLNDGLYPLATVSYNVEWLGADGFKP